MNTPLLYETYLEKFDIYQKLDFDKLMNKYMIKSPNFLKELFDIFNRNEDVNISYTQELEETVRDLEDEVEIEPEVGVKMAGQNS